MVDGDGDFACGAEGERYFQAALDGIAGGKTELGHQIAVVADLIPERDRPGQSTAVQVVIDGVLVGYLADSHANALIQALDVRALQSARVEAMIVGGWFGEAMRGRQGDYFVLLDLPLWVLEWSREKKPSRAKTAEARPPSSSAATAEAGPSGLPDRA
ncbi:hypothetical protein OSH10_03975 [Kaistia defluvii]|uniref:hypothetical protein n=1 Tax=Kaistia defluvii TaxID=410841 RepID=UPI002250D8B1|nr:hypothetical protein [Kaistia defluvii]MCX5517584.1 hypothetical protein [Kaistia defluvii]